MKKHEINIQEEIFLRESLGIKTFKEGVKRYLTYTVKGWFPSYRKDLSPEGVQKERIIDRKLNFYKEYITDQKTGRVIRNVEEKLTDHIK